MANLNVNNYNNLKLRINKDEYWDFFVNKDASICYGEDSSYLDHLISCIDLCDEECHDGSEWIYGKRDNVWNGSIALEQTLHNISYVGVDNGLFTFRKDRISNKDFFELFQNNKYDIASDDFRLKLHAVSGNTLQYEYPLHMEDCYVKLNGGFYQGFFKTECGKYQVLPSKFEDGDFLNLQFVLKKCDLESESVKTLNDKYPNNKGIFFYIGTRAENKWIYSYDKEDVDGLEDCYELGVDDYVEGGEIDKKDYIIGNFYDPNPEFDGYDPFELGDYTDYSYYDESLYKNNDKCDWKDMSDYLDIEYHDKLVVIDKDEPHETLTWCCGEEENDDNLVVLPFFRGCGCPVTYKRVSKDKVDLFNPNPLNGCDEFGDGYIFDNGDIMSLDDARDYIEPELDISDFDYQTDNGFSLAQANQYYFYTDNKFLMFDRTKDGKNVNNWIEGTQFMYFGIKSHFKGNLFILMNRTKTGYTVNTIDSLRDSSSNEYNPYNDIYDNALAFRITDKGEIGYRLLTKNCEKEGRNKTEVIEGYSNEGVIPSCEWVSINIRISFIGGNKMKFMFYINGKLMYVTKELPRINLRKLNDLYEKQEGVPYNISIGGGTQGLAETILQNYMLNPTRVYPIEENFAGSFIGYLKSFKIYNCFMSKPMIEKEAKI